MTDAADQQAAWLETIRRSGISVDREGRFIHEGGEVTHEGLKQALFRWLDRLPPPDGRYVFVTQESVGSDPGAVDVIDLTTLQKVATMDIPLQPTAIAVWRGR